MTFTHYKGFVARIEHSIEDHVYVGEVIKIRDMLCFDGDTEEEAIEVFHGMINDYLIMCKELGRED
jgi:predicted HicB family RNase H-like nuclease